MVLSTAKSMPLSNKKTITLNLIVAVLYVVLGGFTLVVSNELKNIIFASAGVWLAFGILYGPRAAVFGILLGQILLSPLYAHTLANGLAIALFNILACIAGHYFFHRWKLSYGFNKLCDVMLFSILVLFIVQPISSLGSVFTLFALNTITLDALPITWLKWWLSNAVGQLLFAPLFIVWLSPSTRSQTSISALELAGSAIGITLVALIAFSSIPAAQLLVLIITYPLLVWSGLQRGVRLTTFTNVFIALIIITIAASDHGFMANLSLDNRFYYISFFVISASLFSLILFAMFDERRQLIQQLTALANTDFLTKLGNRAYFMDRGEQAVAQAKRHNLPLSLVILDIDKFKKINDGYGHPAGDKVIKSIAKQCKNLLRTEDISARIGGEEFAFIFPNTTKKDAYNVMERLRLAVQNHPISINESLQISITFSAGIAQLQPNESLVDLLQSADKMLYKSKKSGRNQVHVFRNE